MKTVFDAASDIEAHLIGWVDETRTNKKLGPVLRPHIEVLRFYRQYCGRYAVVRRPGRLRVTAVRRRCRLLQVIVWITGVDDRIRIFEAQFCQRLWLFHKFTAALLDLGKLQRHVGFR